MLTSSEIKGVTAEQLLSTVLDIEPKVAVFDCDGTLWEPDSGSLFMRRTMENGLLSHEKAAWLKDRYSLYREGKVSQEAICGEMVQVYEGIAEHELHKACHEFFQEQIEPFIFPVMKDLVDEMHKRSIEIWAVSSTNSWLVEAGAGFFGISPHRVLATRVEVIDGHATSALHHVPTDDGKVIALGAANRPSPCVVFGNSIHDRAMMSVARCSVAINPSPALAEHSMRMGWPIHYPALTFSP